MHTSHASPLNPPTTSGYVASAMRPSPHSPLECGLPRSPAYGVGDGVASEAAPSDSRALLLAQSDGAQGATCWPLSPGMGKGAPEEWSEHGSARGLTQVGLWGDCVR